MITQYLDLITSQHRTQPMFIDWLSASLSIVDDGISITNAISSSFDIDTAVGVQLDVLGEIVGRNRVLNFQPAEGSPVLDDDNYRLIIKAKIAQNQWDGTIPQMYEIWDSLFPDARLYVIDNQNMTMSALIDGRLNPIATELIVSGYIIPKPVTVGITIIGVTGVSSPTYVGIVVNEMDYVNVSIVGP